MSRKTTMSTYTIREKSSRVDIEACQMERTCHNALLAKHLSQNPVGNWYTTLLNAHGNPIEHYSYLDPEMSRLKLHQQGTIKEFIS